MAKRSVVVNVVSTKEVEVIIKATVDKIVAYEIKRRKEVPMK